MHTHERSPSTMGAAASDRWERARRILQRQWLKEPTVRNGVASAVCHGLVGVRVRFEPQTLATSCECAAPQPCEHAFALVLYLAASEATAAHVPAASPVSATLVSGVAESRLLRVKLDPADPGCLLLESQDGGRVPERLAEALRWLWWTRASTHTLHGEARTLAQALQLIDTRGFAMAGGAAGALAGASVRFSQRALGEPVYVKLAEPATPGALAAAALLADRGARPFPGTVPPDTWTLPEETAFAGFYLEATRQGGDLQPDPNLNPKPLRGVRIFVDAGCLPARIRQADADADAPLAHPELLAAVVRFLEEAPRFDEENGHAFIPATRIVDVEEGLRGLGADIEHRRLAPANARHLEWPEELPEDLHGARPRLRAAFTGTLEGDAPRLAEHTELAEYQRVAVAFILHHRHTCLLADDMGLGKTLESIAAAQFLPGRILVVAPASARDVWRREVERFTLEQAAVVGPGDDPAAALATGAKYVITGYSNLDPFEAHLTPDVFDLVILDESHYVKNAATGRAKRVRELLLQVPRRLVVSGTPVMNAPEEMRGQLAFLHPDEWSDGGWFARRFVEPFEGGSPEVREAVLKRLRQFLEGVMIRREKSTALPDLPPKEIRWHRVHLPKEARLAYDAEERAFSAFVQAEGMASLNTPKATGKLERLKQNALNGKMREALAFVRDVLEHGEKVVVFSRYRKALASVERELEAYGPVVLTGTTSASDRAEAARRFQEDDDCRVFLGQLVAAGTAITLTAGTRAVFLDLDWNPANHRQAMDRIHRRGQTRPVSVHFFLAESTVDEDVAEALDEKGRMMDALLAPTAQPKGHMRSARQVVGARIMERHRAALEAASHDAAEE